MTLCSSIVIIYCDYLFKRECRLVNVIRILNASLGTTTRFIIQRVRPLPLLIRLFVHLTCSDTRYNAWHVSLDALSG